MAAFLSEGLTDDVARDLPNVDLKALGLATMSQAQQFKRHVSEFLSSATIEKPHAAAASELEGAAGMASAPPIDDDHDGRWDATADCVPSAPPCDPAAHPSLPLPFPLPPFLSNIPTEFTDQLNPPPPPPPHLYHLPTPAPFAPFINRQPLTSQPLLCIIHQHAGTSPWSCCLIQSSPQTALRASPSPSPSSPPSSLPFPIHPPPPSSPPQLRTQQHAAVVIPWPHHQPQKRGVVAQHGAAAKSRPEGARAGVGAGAGGGRHACVIGRGRVCSGGLWLFAALELVHAVVSDNIVAAAAAAAAAAAITAAAVRAAAGNVFSRPRHTEGLPSASRHLFHFPFRSLPSEAQPFYGNVLTRSVAQRSRCPPSYLPRLRPQFCVCASCFMTSILAPRLSLGMLQVTVGNSVSATSNNLLGLWFGLRWCMCIKHALALHVACIFITHQQPTIAPSLQTPRPSAARFSPRIIPLVHCCCCCCCCCCSYCCFLRRPILCVEKRCMRCSWGRQQDAQAASLAKAKI